MTTVIFSYEHPYPILDQLYQEWFDKVRNESLIYVSNQIQIYKLLLEHHNKNINIDEFLIIKNGVSELINFDIGSLNKVIPNYSFEISKVISKILSKNIEHSFSENSQVAILNTTSLIPDHEIDHWFENVKNNDVLYFSNKLQMLKIYSEALKGNVNLSHFLIKDEIHPILENGKIKTESDSEFFKFQHFDILMKLRKTSP